MADMEKVS